LMLATTIHESNTTPHHQVERHPDSPPPPHSGMTHPHRFPRRDEVKTGLLPQSPTVCLADPHPLPAGPKTTRTRARFLSSFDIHCTRPPPTTGGRPSHDSFGTRRSARCGPARNSWCSLERR